MLELSKEGIIFENVYSPVPLTLPSHISLFTGEDPFQHKIFLNGQFFNPKKNYLPLIFKEKNYSTYGFLSSSILDRAFGTSSGFDFYEDNINTERRCEETLNLFKEKLNTLKEPFFLWIHFFDPHSPYTPPENFKKNFENPYDGEIAYTDFCVGELFKILPENTVSLIIGDHGELLGEHGELQHGVLLYNGAIKVPCLLINPEIKNKKFSKIISFEELYNIIYDYFFQDKKLDDILNKIEEKPVISSSLYGREVFGFEEARAVIFKNYKLILYGEKNFKLFDLVKDPKEEKDISKEKRYKTKEMIKILKEKKFPSNLGDFPKEGEEILKSLGYLTQAKEENLKDPEKGVLVENKIREALERFQINDIKKAVEILNSVLLKYPQHSEALSALGKIYLAIGENKKSLDIFKKLYSLRSDDITANLRYGQALLANNLLDEAEKILSFCIEKNPRLKEAYGELSKIYSKKGKIEKIMELQKKAEENKVEDTILLFEVAKIKESEKKYDESFLLYHKCYKANPLNLEPLLALARVSMKKGNAKMAINYYTQILKIYPNNYEANYNLGILLYILEAKKDESLKYLYKAYNFCPNNNACNKIKEKINKIEKEEKINLEDLYEGMQ